MIIEMRTYLLKPGSVAAFEQRFAEALPNRLKFSKLGAFWHSEIGTLNQVIHVWPYKDFADRERIGGEARKSGQWPPKVREFILTQENKILQAAPFSPPLEEKKLGNVYEIRTYTYQPGAMPTVLERWAKVIGERIKLSPLAACWHTAIGPLNQFIHIWPYQDMAERSRIRAESLKIQGWPPPTRELLLKQENSLVVPAPFSPLH
ncbi:MAG: NIPSNAP family protein [Deltaproteobacteria bacterium]|nr:NIPSNAP family protein [Deltaproteobacteria bacterium]